MWKSKKLQTFWYLVFNEHHFIRGIKSSISWTFTSHFPCTFRWHRNLLVWGNLQDILRPTGKDPDAWKDWGQEKKGATEDGITDSTDMSLSKLREIAKDIEPRLTCCSLWCHKELDTPEWVNKNTSVCWIWATSYRLARVHWENLYPVTDSLYHRKYQMLQIDPFTPTLWNMTVKH